MVHPDKLDEILEDITRIQEEWKRREKERERQKERLALAKIRQEALAAAAARDALQSVAAASHGEHVIFPARRHMSLKQNRKIPSDQSDLHIPGMSNFESCRICGLLINADHPTAMENHMRAHKKNDELRAHLLNTFGPDFVARVTCHECQLVFTDERKLISHAEAMHVRRRKGLFTNYMIPKEQQIASLTKGHGMPPPLGVQSAATRRAVAMAEAVRAQQGNAPRVLTSVEELPCRTTCDFCGLVMVKPSLLIRHMMRVHNKTSFTATVETKGMPSFKITVDQGRLSWSCCEESYSDRSAFVYHRRMNHTPKLAPPSGGTVIGQKTVYFDQQQESAAVANQEEGGGVTDENQYVLLLVNQDGQNEEESDGKPTATAIIPEIPTTDSAGDDGQAGEQEIVLTPEQLQQLGLTGEEGDNVMLLIDDGSGNMTTPDGTQVILDPSQIQQIQTQQQQEGMLVGDSQSGEVSVREDVQVMINEQGEVQLVQQQDSISNDDTNNRTTTEQRENMNEGDNGYVDSVQQFLNSTEQNDTTVATNA